MVIHDVSGITELFNGGTRVVNIHHSRLNPLTLTPIVATWVQL